MPIPPGTKFHGVAPDVETENKGSASRNANRDVYTIEEFGGGGGGGIFETDILYNLTNGHTFGRLSGNGTYPVGDSGVTVVDFIRDVLIMQSATFSATPIPAWQYNLTEVDINVQWQYTGGDNATLVRRVNDGAIEELQTGIAPGSGTFLDDTLPTFPEFTINYVYYYLNVFDAEGNQLLQDVAIATQQAYMVPAVTTTVSLDDEGRSPDENGLIREWGNTASEIEGVATKMSTYVPMTEVRMYSDATEIGQVTVVGDPNSQELDVSNNPSANPTTDVTYTTQVSDTQSDNDGDAFANVSSDQTVSMRPPMMFIANSLDGTGATPGQALYDSYTDGDDGYFRLFAGEFADTFSTVDKMADVSNYAWILYDDSLGAPELRQGGPTGPIVNFDDYGTETITNDFGVSVTVRLLRSPFTGPFSTGTEFYISSNG
tara:strand:+ start:1375 stop:2667 length:1293 start_codon:yes stop_codon:yes gene_type:complete